MDAVQTTRFPDRAHAGRLLAQRCAATTPVATTRSSSRCRAAAFRSGSRSPACSTSRSTCSSRKLGFPGHEECALGAIASGGTRALDREAIDRLGIPAEWIEAIDAKERRELERRERAYRGDRPPPDVAQRTLIRRR